MDIYKIDDDIIVGGLKFKEDDFFIGSFKTMKNENCCDLSGTIQLQNMIKYHIEQIYNLKLAIKKIKELSVYNML